MENLVLIDGNSLINRAFYAMPLLTTKKGEYTNAVYGFMNMFAKIAQEIKPTYVAVAFDLKAPTFRHKMYSEYKGTRKPMPEELRPQIPLLKSVLKTMNVCTVEKEGFEADDIIGTIAKSTDIKTYIFTGDKDSFQLVDEQTEIHFTKRGISDVDIYNADNFKEKMGICPIQIIDLKALMGDSSDNIPGVPGVGEKTALNLVQTYGSVENLYNNTAELKGKLNEKILNGKELCFLSKTLATINVNVDINTNLNDMRFVFPFNAEVKKTFIDLEFKSLYGKTNLFSENELNAESQSLNFNKTALKQTIRIKDLTEFDMLKGSKTASIVIEEDKVAVFSESTEYQARINQTLLDDGFNLSEILKALKFLFTEQTKLIAFNKKQLKQLLKTSEIELSAPTEDVSLLKYLLDFSGGEETLSETIAYYKENPQTPAYALYNIFETLCAELKQDSQTEKLYKEVELPLSDVLFDMETAGFKVDSSALSKAGEIYKKKLALLENEIRLLANSNELNVNSPKQLGEVLFEKLKIGKGKKTKTGYSTSAEVLENLEDAHPIVGKILEYRKLQKLHSTYIEGFKPLIDKNSGLIHTSFNQTVTVTGRLSSKEPNLQNIPVRDELGKELRKFFVSRYENGVLVSADYSQIELRLLAAFSECEALIKAFNNGEDIHRSTASKVMGVKEEEVTPEMRSNAKAVNFGIIYGMSEYGLAKTLKISPAEARKYIDSYFNQYPEVKNYMNNNVAFAKATGYAVTVLGRKRYIKELSSSNYALRQFGERAAMNMPLQGSSADIIKLAMLGVYKRLKQEKLQAKLILQVHDELIVDSPENEKNAVIKILTEEMEGALKLSVPLTVSVSAGKSWFSAK